MNYVRCVVILPWSFGRAFLSYSLKATERAAQFRAASGPLGKEVIRPCLSRVKTSFFPLHPGIKFSSSLDAVKLPHQSSLEISSLRGVPPVSPLSRLSHAIRASFGPSTFRRACGWPHSRSPPPKFFSFLSSPGNPGPPRQASRLRIPLAR